MSAIAIKNGPGAARTGGARHRIRGPALLLTVILVLTLALASRAEAFVYWTNLNGTTIGRANLDGTDVNQNFILGANLPRGVAVDGAHIYWANFAGQTIGRANLDGTGIPDQNFITVASEPCGVAVSATHVYWGNLGSRLRRRPRAPAT